MRLWNNLSYWLPASLSNLVPLHRTYIVTNKILVTDFLERIYLKCILKHFLRDLEEPYNILDLKRIRSHFLDTSK